MSVLIIYVGMFMLVSGFVGRHLSRNHGYNPETEDREFRISFGLGAIWPVAPLVIVGYTLTQHAVTARNDYEAQIQEKIREHRARQTAGANA